MTRPRDPDTIIATWLEDGPINLPDETRRAILIGLRTQPRARQVAILRGLPVNPIARFAAAAAIVLAVGGLSVFVLSNRRGGQGALPTPGQSPSPSIAPSPSAGFGSTAGWLTFTSARYGYEINYPPSWSSDTATRDWVLATDRGSDLLNGQADAWVGGPDGTQIRVAGFAANVPPGTTEDAWLSSYYAGSAYCSTSQQPTFVPITVDGHPGQLETCFDAQAFVFIDQRVYVFSIWRSNQQPLFRAFLSTVKFPAASPGPS